MKPNTEVVWFNLAQHMYWMVEHINGIKFGGDVENGAYAWLKDGAQSYQGIFDSGTSATLIPKDIYYPFLTRFFQHSARSVSHSTAYGMTRVSSCDASLFPTVYLLVESHWVEMSPKDYLLRTTDTGVCYLGFHESPVDFFVFGDTVMRGYYSIHSDENGLLGLIPHAQSHKQ